MDITSTNILLYGNYIVYKLIVHISIILFLLGIFMLYAYTQIMKYIMIIPLSS